MSCQEYIYYGYGFSAEEIRNIDLVKEIILDAFQDEEEKTSSETLLRQICMI